MKNILIVGAGQLGCRHLQALSNSKIELNIIVVDPYSLALDGAKKSWDEVSSKTNSKIFFYQDFEFESKEIDVAVIATNSVVRYHVTQAIVKNLIIKNIVFEKFLFPVLGEYAEVENLLKEKNIKAWVNCPRRMFSFYKKLSFEKQGPLHFVVSGGNWGLGCNGIHFLDLFSMLSGNIPLRIYSALDNTILKSKREGYIEFTGSIFGSTENGDTFSINSSGNENQPLAIYLADEQRSLFINEADKSVTTLINQDASQDNNIEYFIMPYQSELTNIFVDSILEQGTCDLTPFLESSSLHKLMLEVFLQHYNNLTLKPNNTLCPIT